MPACQELRPASCVQELVQSNAYLPDLAHTWCMQELQEHVAYRSWCQVGLPVGACTLIAACRSW